MALERLNRRKAMILGTAGLLSPFIVSRQVFSGVQAHRIDVVSRVLDVIGKPAKVFGLVVDGAAKPLRTRYGRDFATVVNNGLTEDTIIHWHGLTPPVAQDGVLHLSGPAIKAGASQAYQFANSRTGTHWMHSHLGLQEQRLLAAPLIVEENGAALVDEQEHVVMLHDFTFRDPAEIMAELQGGGGLHAGHGAKQESDPHAGHKMEADPHAGHNMGEMAQPATHLNDIVYDAMLANDRTLDDPEIVLAEKGGRFRLRVINGAAASNMWIDLGNLEGELIAVDGNSIRPVKGKRFPLAVAQRADVRLALPAGSGAYPILFTVEGSGMRSGIVLKAGESAVSKISVTGKEAPALDLSLETQMVSIAETPDNPVARVDTVMLTGGGSDYQWGFNGKAMMHDTLMTVREGERYEIMMHNMTGMAHPMHLHGHYFRVVGIDGQRFKGAIRDTVLVPPGQMVTIQFDADNPGQWAFHCHHLYHMNSGMMAAISYQGAA
jgi:FtsP/CotA-like multicopper oxidase with cupredoxin domain